MTKNKDWDGNKNSLYKVLGASNHVKEERAENDFYATDPIAIDKLLQVENPFPHIWECAAGNGHLAKRLKEHGYNVITSDIIERDYELDFIQDFLKMSVCGLGTKEEYDIITNPPYKFAKEFVLKALHMIKDGRKVYMFLKLQFLEGKARYNELFSKYPPKNVYVFSERIACAKNGEFHKIKELGGSAVAFAWFVWEKGFLGETIIRWL